MSPRDDLKKIYSAAIDAVDPYRAVKNSLKREGDRLFLVRGKETLAEYDLKSYERILVLGAGKATAPMARAAEEILGGYLSGGCIVVKYGYTEKLNRIETREGAHPVPDEAGNRAAEEIFSIARDAGEKDLLLSLISGGGSALLPLPPEGITLEEKQATTDLLLKSGATIHEINSVRKHLSRIKGGNLARAASSATVINLMISDVVGDVMSVIASGPFVADTSTFSGAVKILQKYGLTEKVPGAVVEYLKKGAGGEVKENPAAGDSLFKKVTNAVVASNIIALEAAAAAAEEAGYNTCILSSLIEGDTRETAFWHSRIAGEVIATGHPAHAPACIVSGGETTVIVTGNGLGGRNMEFALQAAPLIAGNSRVIMASIGTDGTDGPTDAAGALVDGTTMKRAAAAGLVTEDYMEDNDSYNYFKKINDLIVTGPTNTNVMDIRIVLVTE